MAITRFDLTQPPGPRMSRCVVRGDTVYLAGLTAGDTSQDIKGQTKQILDKIDGYLAQAGTSKSNLLVGQSVDQGHGAVRRHEFGVERLGRSREPAGARLRQGRSGAPGTAGRNHGDRREITPQIAARSQ